MKPYFAFLVLTFFPIIGFSQSNGRSATATNYSLTDRSILEQCLWGYSKNSTGKNGKVLIDFNVIENWRGLGDYVAASDDGKFFAFTINKPSGTRYWFNRLDSLVIQSTTNSWRMAFAKSKPGFFTANGQQYIFQNGESLYFLQLGTSQVRNMTNVVSYKVSQRGKNEWLAYQMKNNEKNFVLQNLGSKKEISFVGITDYNFDNNGEWLVCKGTKGLVLYNLAKGTEKHFPFVEEYAFANNGKAVLLKAVEKNDNGITTNLIYLHGANGQGKIIWSTNKENAKLGSYSLDNLGRQVVFSIQDSTGTNIWYCNAEMDKAVVKVTNATPGINEGLALTSESSFTDDGRYIKFFVQQTMSDTRKPEDGMAQVEIWGHKDLYLQSTQAELSKQAKVYTALCNIETGKVIGFEDNGRKLYLQQGDFAVVKKNIREEHGDRFWDVGNRVDVDSNWIVNLKDGSSKLLPTNAGSGRFWFSPGGKYLVYFDIDKGCHFFSYELYAGVFRDITENLSDNKLGFVNPYRNSKHEFGNLAAWIEKDAGVLAYDNNDIWRLDLTGKNPAINITNGFGRLNSTILLLATTNHYSSDIPVITAEAPLLLRAFNTRNKESGFYRKANLNAGAPKLVYMGNYFQHSVDGWHDPNLSNNGMAPLKVKNRETWIVQRQSSNDAPNYYATNDFNNYRRLTNFQPQQNLRWISEELHSFKHFDGRDGQGILYKPDDFDPTKKYPVLIVFYGTFSNNLNQFRVPTYLSTAIAPGESPVWLVNNGYLVFTPDIYTAPLKYGPSAFNVIEGAAQYLKQLSFVDANKLGCASHSWSAKLGAYLFTHSKSFAATTISEGFLYANPINMAFSVKDGKSRLEDVENGMEYGSLYENKETWLEQTTVLQADKANSPLLLFCNKESSADYQDQTIQFFTALRRLSKPVWWLKYDNGSHTLRDLKELKDYTIRYTQFFDHYLNDAPAPLWMTQGLPITAKGIETRYELDAKGSCGKDCKVCKKWNEQYKKHPEMFNKPIQEWHWD